MLLYVLLLLSPALADVSTPYTGEDDCVGRDDGDACETDDGADGTCDDEVCVEDGGKDDDDDSGCSTAGAPVAAWGLVGGSLALLAVGRRRA